MNGGAERASGDQPKKGLSGKGAERQGCRQELKGIVVYTLLKEPTGITNNNWG